MFEQFRAVARIHVMRLAILVLPVLAATAYAVDRVEMIERSLKVTGNVDLEIRTDSGSIAVLPGDSGVVTVRGKVRANSSNWLFGSNSTSLIKGVLASPPIYQNGNSIRLDEPSDPDARRHLSISWEVTVPPATKVNAHADSGSISIRGAAGPIRAAADSGSIRIENAIADVDASADSGSIEITGGSSAKASADSGSIRLNTIAGPVEASTDSGSIAASLTKAASARLSADSGSITLDLPDTGGYDVSLSADSGRVSVDPSMALSGTIKQHVIRGKIRGGGNTVTASTDSGSITVR
jgi:hypothetical protein